MITKEVDYLIIGAGPAGLQLGYFLEKQGQDYLILERAEVPGSFFQKYPRHNTIISINKVYTGYDDPEINMRWDWNSLICDDPTLRLPRYTKEYFPHKKYLVHYFSDFAQQYRLKIRYRSKVVKVSKNHCFNVTLANGDVYLAKRLIVATGYTKAYWSDIPGIELADHYADMSLKKEKYINKRVLVIGKGNSGFETADYLVDSAALIHVASRYPLNLAWQTHYVGHLRAVNNNFLDTYQLKSQNALINAEISAIKKIDNKFHVTFAYSHANEEVETLVYDHVLACTGFQMDDSIFSPCCKPEKIIDDRFPNMTSWYESVNVPDLYFAGTLMQVRDFKKKQSAFIHGFRYNVEFLANYLRHRYHQQSLPHTDMKLCPKAISEAIIKTVNRSSALWQQTGYLCDAFVFDAESETCRHYPTAPTDFFTEGLFTHNTHYLVVVLNFNQHLFDEVSNVFGINRVHKDDVMNAHQSPSLHPIVYHYCGKELISVHHIIEDFETVWEEPVHTDPLKAYLDKTLTVVRGHTYKARSAPHLVEVV